MCRLKVCGMNPKNQVCLVVVLALSFFLRPVIGQEDIGTRMVGEDWPTFLGTGTDGKSNETGIIKDWSDDKLKLLWQVKTGQGYSIGSVSNGKFYHFGFLNDRATLLCLNAETGKEVWKFEYESKYRDLYGYDSGPRTSPVIDGDRVYIYGVEGTIHCLNTETGKVIWKLPMNEKFGVIQNFFGVSSTPVVFEDLLLVMVGGSPEESKKAPPGRLDLVVPNKTGIVALDKLTGQIKYTAVDDLASYASLKLTELEGSPVLLALMRSKLFAVEPRTGKVLSEFPWRSRKLESVNASTPVVVDKGTILISECYEIGSALIQLDEGSMTSIWNDRGKRDKAMEAHWNTPIVVGDFMYGCSGRHAAPAELRCVNWKTGELQWKKSGLSRSSLTLVDGHFIVVGEMGELLLIKANPKKFEEVTRYKSNGTDGGIKFRSPCWAAPVISHGLMYVRGKDQMACFELIPE